MSTVKRAGRFLTFCSTSAPSSSSNIHDRLEGGSILTSEGLEVEFGVACCQGPRAYMEDRFSIASDLHELGAEEDEVSMDGAKRMTVGEPGERVPSYPSTPEPASEDDMAGDSRSDAKAVDDASTAASQANAKGSHANAKASRASFFAVFDGHGGPVTSTYCSERVPRRLASSPHFPRDMRRALDDAMRLTDSDLMEEMGGKCRMDGSTGLVAVISGHDVWFSNVGDSRAVVYREDGGVEDVTVDHKPDSPEERARIERMGGVVRRGKMFNIMMGPYRVYRRSTYFDMVGGLALSRALGDFFYKSDGLEGERSDDLVTSLPDIYHFRVDPNNDRFCILASDGLWDVFSSSEAARLAQGLLANGQATPADAAHALIREALSRSALDNITVLILSFKSK